MDYFLCSLDPELWSVFDEILERFVFYKPAEYSLSPVRLSNIFDNLFSYDFELYDESAMVFGELVFEFFSDVSCVCGAVSICSDCDLKVSSFYDGWYVKIAEFGDIDDVAEDFELLTVFEDLVV